MSEFVSAIMFIIALSFIVIVPLFIVFVGNLLKKSRAHRIAGKIIIIFSTIAIASFIIGIIATFEVQSGIALILGLVIAQIISWGGAFIAWIVYLITPKDLSAKK